MQVPSNPSVVFRFGRCQFLRQRGELLIDGKPVEIGRRALDVLAVLIEAEGRLVTKDDLLSRVWPGRVVEENTLHVHLSALRKALGEDGQCLITVSGRGYRFVADTVVDTAENGPALGLGASTSALSGEPRVRTNLSRSVSELIGRDAALQEVCDYAAEHRLVTLTGTGGIGKTRLAVEAAWRLLPEFADGAWIAELGPLSDPDLVPATVATALGLTLAVGVVSPEEVAAALGRKRVLLVLDSCEHMIGAAARMAETLIRANPLAHVLATTREPLRAVGEYVYRVPPLQLAAEADLGNRELLSLGAVQLFVARAQEAALKLPADRGIAELIAGICRRLDGLPLAIELAAARTAALGLDGLAALLDDRFKLLTGGYRTALPRHQTLRATLDWSYELLSEPERATLRRLGVFAGSFSLEAAGAVTASAEIPASDIVEHIADLVAKSLVAVDLNRTTARYRLLDTTRAYALEKLADTGELEELARRHAEHYRDFFAQAEAQAQTQSHAEWMEAYGRQIDNLRAALDWAFSTDGERDFGIALTIAAIPVWMRLSLIGECQRRIERALAGLRPGLARDADSEMRLLVGLGGALNYTSHVKSGPRWIRALELADQLGDREQQMRAIRGLVVYRVGSGDYRAALALAERFYQLASQSPDSADTFVGNRLIAVPLYYLGDQANARRHVERALDCPPAYAPHVTRFQFDQRIAARLILARILWVQGFPDQAVQTARLSVEDARTIGHPLSTCYALEAMCWLPFLVGDLSEAGSNVAALRQHAAAHAVSTWQLLSRCFEGALLIRRGEAGPGSSLLRAALDDYRENAFAPHYTVFLAALAEGLAGAGQLSQALLTIDEALGRSERNEEGWCLPELLRIKAELVLQERAAGADTAAERYMSRGLERAREQRALAWELRCATGLARLQQARGRRAEGYAVLRASYDRFTEGFDTNDLATARALLAELS